jgi:hypothetical protein
MNFGISSETPFSAEPISEKHFPRLTQAVPKTLKNQKYIKQKIFQNDSSAKLLNLPEKLNIFVALPASTSDIPFNLFFISS